jgi:hypothetical protein
MACISYINVLDHASYGQQQQGYPLFATQLLFKQDLFEQKMDSLLLIN